MKRQLLSALLALCMVLTLLPVSAMALSPEACWGVAAEDGTKPAEWAGSGTLQDAVTYANGLSRGTAYIQLQADVTAATTATFTRGTTILDLNGGTLSGSSSSGVITLSGGTLTIEDSSEGGNGKVTPVGSNSAINVNGGTVNVNGGSISKSGYRTISNSGTVNVNGGEVIGGFCAIYNSGTVSVTGGKVSGTRSVIDNRGTVRVTGGTVKNNSTNTTEEFAIKNSDNGRVIIDGGEVSGPFTIFMPSNSTSTVNVNGGNVTSLSNYAIESQGKGSISVTGGEIFGNGGAIRCSEYSTATVHVTGGKLTSTTFWTIFNYGTGSGTGSLSVTDARVEGKSNVYGAIYHRGTGMFEIGGTAVVTSPSSNSTSGTVYMVGNSALEITGGTVENTSTGSTGNAIYGSNTSISIKSGSPITIKGPGMAMSSAPTLTDTVVKKAATNVDGTEVVETYDSNNITSYKYLEFMTAAAKIGDTCYTTVQEAVDAVENGQTVTLVRNVQENISITGSASFTMNLNDKTLDGGTGNAITHHGSGRLTITDSGNGGVTGSMGISGTGTGEIIVLCGTIEGTDDSAINCAQLKIDPAGKVVIKSGTQAMSVAPTLPEDTASYQWRTSDEGAFAMGPYAWDSSHTYVEIRPAYTVTYHPGTNGAGSQATDTKTYGVNLTLRGVLFTRDGYTQTGWATTDGGAKAYALGGSYTANAAINLYPVWTPDTYTVTYCPGDYGTGRQITNSKTHGVALALSGAVFTREGYTQTGWATTDGGAKAYELSGSYTANAAINLYPVWTPSTYGVTYRPGVNGTGSQATDSKTHDVALTLSGAVFTREGYTQTGWATTDGGTKAYELGGSYTANTAITLYPAWTPDTYVVTYLPGINGTGSQATDSKTHDVALTLSGAVFTREGYTQTGWATTDGGTKAYELGGSYTANTAITLYPAWTPDTYVVTYHPGTNGTGSQATDSKTHDVALKLGGAIFTREGYTQTGWATTDGGEQAFALGGSYTANTAIDLYPVWTQSTYAVTYRPGANGTGSQTADHKTHDIALTLRGSNFTRAGYTQTGWAITDGGTKAFELGDRYTTNSAITLYPVWMLNTYAVTYRPGTNGTGNQAEDSKAHDIDLTLRGAVFTRTGYTQTGWATTDGGTKAYELGGSYIANAGLTLFPAWTPNTYAVTYNPGTNGIGSQTADHKTHDIALTLRGSNFTRAGYTQTGWATTDGGAQAFELGGSYTANAGLALYPVWTKNPPNTYTVSLPAGTGFSAAVKGGSSSPVTHGGSFSFTVAIESGYHKGGGFAVKANGASLTENGSGVYTIANITQAQTVTVEGVEQDSPAPAPSPTFTPPEEMVYNNPSIPDATIWLAGSGLAGDDLLMTQTLTGGSDYNVMLKLADGNDVLLVYEISLQSGTKSTGNPMFLTFDLTEQYAGQAMTLVHKKADGTFEYFYGTAGADGKVTFGVSHV